MTDEDAMLDSIYDEVTAKDIGIDDAVVSLLREIATLRALRDALRVDAAAMSITIKDAAWLLLNARGTEYLAMVEASYKLTEHMERLTAALHPLEVQP